MYPNMKRRVANFSFFLCLNAGGILFAQQKAANANARYYRIICLVHLTGSGKAGDPVLPEYVAQGTVTAQAALTAAIAASPVSPSGNGPAATTAGSAAVAHAVTAQPTGQPTTPPTAGPTPVSASAVSVPRPGFLGWSMQISDDGKMAIVHIVAADPAAFAAILADTATGDSGISRLARIHAGHDPGGDAAIQEGFNLASFEEFGGPMRIRALFLILAGAGCVFGQYTYDYTGLPTTSGSWTANGGVDYDYPPGIDFLGGRRVIYLLDKCQRKAQTITKCP